MAWALLAAFWLARSLVEGGALPVIVALPLTVALVWGFGRLMGPSHG